MPTVIDSSAGSRAVLQTNLLAQIAGSTPASFFGIVLGLGGLANTWRAAQKIWGLPHYVSEGIFLTAGVVWFALIVLYAGKLAMTIENFRQEANNPILCCYIGLVGVATMLIAGGILPYSYGWASAIYLIGFAITALFGIWRTGALWKGERDPAHTTAVLYLPTVAGSFVTATVASRLGYPEWGQFALGSGLFSWLAMESVILHRLLMGPTTATAIRPTLGIHLAPAPVGAVAYVAVTGAQPDIFVHALIGYGILQLAILTRLIGWFRETGAVAGFWGFSFGVTSMAVAPLQLVVQGDNYAISIISVVMFTLANLLVGWLSIMTVWLLLSGRLYPSVRFHRNQSAARKV